jgi:SAM-dependent methyltransferase
MVSIHMPLHLRGSDDFEYLRNYLRAADFNEKSICSRLDIRGLQELLSGVRMRVTLSNKSDELGILTRLFLFGESFMKGELGAVFPSRLPEVLANLGLVSEDALDCNHLFSPVALYPVGPLFIVSDRWCELNDKGFVLPDEFVFPAITPNTSQFLANLPLTPCGSFLELCSGTGAAALAASRFAQHAWAVDITERSAQMGEFNRLLNGLDNVTVLKGDLYEGVQDLRFDRIVAHPPCMPELHPGQIFYDGGVDGEQVTRRIVEGLPRYLKPGGCFYCLAQGSDRKGAAFEQRVRGWLGENEAEFDVVVVIRQLQNPQDAAVQYGMKSKGGSYATGQMLNGLLSLGVESVIFGWIVVQQREESRKVFTVRRTAGPQARREEIAWLLKWEAFAAGPLALDSVQEMTPVANRSLELHAVYRLKDGGLVPDPFTLHAEDPFIMDCQVPAWVGSLIPHCDGKSTIRQLLEMCKASNLIHPDAPLEEFAKLLMILISGGFLEVAGFSLPNRHAGEIPLAHATDDILRQPL